MALLTPVYEAEFLGFSYGFRPGRGQHEALDALAYGLGKRRINWVLDAGYSRSGHRFGIAPWFMRSFDRRVRVPGLSL